MLGDEDLLALLDSQPGTNNKPKSSIWYNGKVLKTKPGGHMCSIRHCTWRAYEFILDKPYCSEHAAEELVKLFSPNEVELLICSSPARFGDAQKCHSAIGIKYNGKYYCRFHGVLAMGKSFDDVVPDNIVEMNDKVVEALETVYLDTAVTDIKVPEPTVDIQEVLNLVEKVTESLPVDQTGFINEQPKVLHL